jgi:hypothetical protein
MFYCDDCADERRWPKTLSRVRGPCEVCRKTVLCNEFPSDRLPSAEETRRDLNQQELEQVPDEELVQRFEDMLRRGAGTSYNGLAWAKNELLHRLKARRGATRTLTGDAPGKR